MAIIVAIKHNTSYKYDRLINMAPHIIRLKPAPHSRTKIHSYSLNIEPKEHFINWQQDSFGNYMARIVMNEKVKEFKVEVEVIAEMTVINPFDFFVEEYAKSFPFKYETQDAKELAPYFEIVESGPLLMNWLKKLEQFSGLNIVDFLVAVNQALYNQIDYTVRLEPGVFTCEESLEKQLNDAGYPLDINWLEPFFEFRFPHIGRVEFKDIKLSMRTAIEPWNVLGEEMSSSGTARFVDSSVERIEVKAQGLVGERYAILCNGMRIPMINTGTKGEFVASIRYRAWQPPSALHPNLGIDTPLVFDIFDLWVGKSVAGCNYHVFHPGGRVYDTFPVNSFEAEGRRVSRFYNENHTQGVYTPKEEISTEVRRYILEKESDSGERVVITPKFIEPDAEYPHTFDLRKIKSMR